MPSVSSSSRPKVLLSSTVMTPSLPTLSIASEIISPIAGSPAEMDAVEAICSLVSTSLAAALSSSETRSTAASMPRFRLMGLAPAATLRRPSRTSAWARMVAVVVPSPATSLVFLATSLTSSAPIFSYGSSRSISLAMDTPSLVIVGAPHFLSSTTLRPFGPRVTRTASASTFMPRSRPRRASSSNAMILAMRCGSSRVADDAGYRPAPVPATDGSALPHLPAGCHSSGESASPLLALSGGECKRLQEMRSGEAGPANRQPGGRSSTNGVAPATRARAAPRPAAAVERCRGGDSRRAARGRGAPLPQRAGVASPRRTVGWSGVSGPDGKGE